MVSEIGVQVNELTPLIARFDLAKLCFGTVWVVFHYISVTALVGGLVIKLGGPRVDAT